VRLAGCHAVALRVSAAPVLNITFLPFWWQDVTLWNWEMSGACALHYSSAFLAAFLVAGCHPVALRVSAAPVLNQWLFFP